MSDSSDQACGKDHDKQQPQFDGAAVAKGLPNLPGVYRMLDAAGDVLYVGKAKDLRKRVASYFQKSAGVSPRIQLMLRQVSALETTATRSEAEALLLENNLIKSLNPRYNILYRDDKSYPYLVLSGHDFPRLGFYRGALDQQNRYFGPFSSAGAVRESIHLMQKVFRLRTCEDSVFSNRSRPCLLYQIRRCSGPCVGQVDRTDYEDDVRNATLFLQGRESEAVTRLEQRMTQAAARQQYELAAVLRDQIRALSKVRETQFVSSNTGVVNADVVALAAASGVLCVNLVMIRGGIHRGDKSFFPQNARERDEEEALQAFLAQHYLSREVPPLVVVNRAIEPGAAGTNAFRAVGAQGADSQQSQWRAAGVVANGGKECRTGYRATAQCPCDPGGTFEQPASLVGLTRDHSAHRVLRYQPHDGRSHCGLLRCL